MSPLVGGASSAYVVPDREANAACAHNLAVRSTERMSVLEEAESVVPDDEHGSRQDLSAVCTLASSALPNDMPLVVLVVRSGHLDRRHMSSPSAVAFQDQRHALASLVREQWVAFEVDSGPIASVPQRAKHRQRMVSDP